MRHKQNAPGCSLTTWSEGKWYGGGKSSLDFFSNLIFFQLWTYLTPLKENWSLLFNSYCLALIIRILFIRLRSQLKFTVLLSWQTEGWLSYCIRVTQLLKWVTRRVRMYGIKWIIHTLLNIRAAWIDIRSGHFLVLSNKREVHG